MSEYNEKQNIIIAEQIKSKYDIWLEDDGKTLHGPKISKHNGETPVFNIESNSEKLFETEDIEMLKEFMENKFTASENPDFIVSIVNKIVKQITNQDIQNSANVIIMTSDEFHYINSIRKSKQNSQDEIIGENHGIHYPGGLILIDGSHASGTIPLILHEVGHSFYEESNDRFTDELRAMYFQIISTEMFEKELKKVGIDAGYGNYYENSPLPTAEHQDAWTNARALNAYISNYEQVFKGNEKAEERFRKLLPLIKQPFSFET